MMMNPTVIATGLRLGASVLGSGVAVEVVGASAFAISASTVILATGGAAALVLAGYGIYKAACK
jgi:aspartate oxidase